MQTPSVIRMLASGAALVLALGACDKGSPEALRQPSSLQVTHFGTNEVTELEIKPLDHADNPFAEHYGEWDRWAAEHLYGVDKVSDFIAMDGQESLTVAIDHSGFVIPQLELKRRYHEAVKTDKDLQNYQNGFFAAFAFGDMPDQLYLQLQDELDMVSAPYYPPIPEWVVRNLPRAACFYPNGDVITFGELGSQQWTEPSVHDAELEFCRYDSNGNLISKTMGTRFHLYHNYKEHGNIQGEYDDRNDGYVYYRDAVTKNILSIWDFDGTQLPSVVEPPYRDRHPFRKISARRIERLFNAQQAIKENVK